MDVSVCTVVCCHRWFQLSSKSPLLLVVCVVCAIVFARVVSSSSDVLCVSMGLMCKHRQNFHKLIE